MYVQSNPYRYFFSRLFVNFPGLFSRLSFARNGYLLSMSPNAVAASFFVYGNKCLSYDEQVLTALVGKDDFFVDVGANIGHLSLALAKTSGARGFAIEANPKTFKFLSRNVRINNLLQNLIALNYAVGETDGDLLQIQDSFADDCNSIVDTAYKVREEDNLYTVSHDALYSVQSRTLDSLAEEHNFPSINRMLKVDVEGYELFVLRGATKLLQSTEIIYFEYWNKLTRKCEVDPENGTAV